MAGPWDTPPTEADRVDAPVAPTPTPGVWDAPPKPEEAVGASPPPPTAQPTGQDLQATGDLVAPVDPERHAKVLDLAGRMGVPPAIVQADPAGFEKAASAPDLQMLPSHAPRTARWLSDPGNMALAKDDAGTLGTVESLLQYGVLGAIDWSVRKAGGEGDRPLWTGAFRKGLAGLQVSLDKTLEQLGADPAASLFTHPWVALRAPFRTLVGAEVAPAEELEAAKREDAATAARDLGAKSLVAKAWAGTFQAVPYLGGAMGAGAVAGPAGIVGFGAAATYGETRERLGEIRGPQGEQLTPEQKTAIALPVALGVGAVQAAPIAKYLGQPILGRLAPDIFDRILSSTTVPAIVARFAGRTSVHAAAGAVAMAAGSALEDTAVQLAADGLDPTLPERDPGRWGRVVDRAWQTFEDGLRDFALISAFGAGRQALHDAGLRAESQRQAAAIQAIGEAAQASKLAARSEGATQEAVSQMAPGSSWLVSREAWDGYWRSKGIDPAAKAADVAGDQGHSYEASAGSGFVAFPTAAYVAKLGKSAHLLALAPDSKWTADARTASEQAKADQADARMLEELQKARGADLEAEKREVVETIKKAASGVKQVKADEVETVASLVAENAGSYALRMGIPVAEAVNLMGLRRLRFTGAGGEEAARLAQADLRDMLSPEAAATLDAARAGDRRAIARLESAAYRDPLTGLLNRTAFVDYRRTRAPGGWDVAVDANDLAAQDVLGGHEVGDAMLTRVAQAMREAADATGAGRLYRWGGDEFHAGSFKSQAEAEAFAQAVRERLGAAPEIAKGFRPSVSMGVGPDVASADSALYEAKAQKAAKVGRFEKGKPETVTPELGKGESFVAVRIEPAKGARPVTEIAGKAVTLEQGARGLVRMRIDATGRPIDFPVELFAGADVSTLAHEVGGHFLSWAMHDVAADPRATAPIRGDYEALVKWAGYGSPDQRLQESLERGDLESRASLAPADQARLKALRAKEERIGHGFEQYLAEGKAPSAALARAFARMRTWLLRIYRGLFGIGEQYRREYGQELGLSDEVRGVFDRWFSAETEVRNQEAEGASGAYLAALDPADREAVLRAREARRLEAETATYQTLTQAEKGATEDVRAGIRKEVLAQAEQEPVYRLREYLARPSAPEAGIVEAALGRLDSALLDEHGRPWKLSRPAVEAAYGPEIVKRLPRGSTVKEGGIDPELLADRFGFADAAEMIRSLADAPALEKAVEDRLGQRMRDLFPSAAEDPRGVVEAAVEAEHGPRAAEEALLGARILVRRVVPEMAERLRVMEDVKTRNGQAARIVADMRIADLSPEALLARERAEARLAQEFTAKALGGETGRRKEFAALAMDHRDAQLLDMALYRAARDAKAEAEQAQTKAKRRTTEEYRRRLGKVVSYGEDGKVTQPYLDRMDDLLGRIDWRQSGKQAGAVSRFLDWVKDQPADKQQDIFAGIPEKFIASLDKATHWTDLTVQEMRDLVQAMDVIDAQARLKAKLRLAGEERDFEETVQRIQEEIRTRWPQGGGVSGLERVEPILWKLKNAGLLTLKAQFALRAELYRELGPTISSVVWGELSKGYDLANRFIVEMGKPIAQELRNLNRRDRAFLRETFVVEGQTLDGEAALAFALNSVNESNYQKMVRGEIVKAKRFKLARPLSQQGIEAAMSKLGRAHWQFVNRVTKQLSSRWDDMVAMEKRLVGLAPPKIEGRPQVRTLPDGSTIEVPGGYYPVVYDPKFSTAGRRAAEKGAAGVQALAFAPSYERQSTPQGHLQARIEPFARPVDRSLAGLQRAVVNHMRDLALREPLLQAREILTDGRVADAIEEAMGPRVYQSLLEHWRKTANEFAEPQGPVDSLVTWMGRKKTMFTASVIGGNMALAIQNFANIPGALTAVGPGRFFPAAGRLVAALPRRALGLAFSRFTVERMDMVDRIHAESEYMRQRADFLEASTIKAGLRISTRDSRVDRYAEHVRRVAGWFMEGTDLATAYPTYEAAKALALAPKGEGVRGLEEAGPRATGLGMTEKEAIAFAERTVQLTLGSYRWIDRPAFSQHPIFKPFTYFWGYMASQMSRFMGINFDSGQLWHQDYHMEGVRRAAVGWGLLIAGGIMAEALVGNGPEDYGNDGEIGLDDWGRWLATTGALYPFTTAPIIGSQIRNLGATKGPSRDISLFPWIRGGQVAWKAYEAAKAAASEEAQGGEGLQAFLGGLEAVGWYYGLPVVQMRRTGDYWADITPDGLDLSEEAAQASLPEAAWKTVYGKGRPGRLSEALFPRGP